MWSLKQSRPLKDVERVTLSLSDSSTFSIFTNDNKRTDWRLVNIRDGPMRAEFLWWLVIATFVHCKTTLQNNLDELAPPIYARYARTLSGLQAHNELSISALSSARRTLLSTAFRQGAGKQPTTSNTGDALTGEVISLPSITEAEAADLEALMSQSGIDVATIHLLESSLLSRVAALERESAALIFEAQAARNSDMIGSLLEHVMDGLEEVESWVTMHDTSLGKMRTGIEKIETRSEALDVRFYVLCPYAT